MKRSSDMSLEVSFTERLGRSFPLVVPFFPIDNEYPGSVKGPENIANEFSTNVILTIVPLDVL